MNPLHVLSLAVLALAVSSAHAQSISPQPEPGLWRSEATTLINGEDVLASMRAAQQEMFNSMPPEQLAAMQAVMGDAEDLGIEMQCITAEQAVDMIDARAVLAEAKREMPGCDLQVEQTSRSVLSFTGNCNGKEGFSGAIQGELTMVSSREMRTAFNGKGEYQIDMHDIPAELSGSYGGPVDIHQREVSKWVAADCGDVQPTNH